MKRKVTCSKCNKKILISKSRKGNSGKIYCQSCFSKGELLETLDDLPTGGYEYPCPCPDLSSGY